MTNKELTIQACKQISKKYREMKKIDGWFIRDNCPLCKIHYKTIWKRHRSDKRCTGCPLADMHADVGCLDFASAKELIIELNTWYDNDHKDLDYKHLVGAAKDRAEFYDKIIPILEQIPEERFTREGWTYFEELDRGW